MSWTIHWSMEGYTTVEADTIEEARAVFAALTPSEMRDLGDYETPEAYFVEEDGADDVIPMRTVQLPGEQ